MSDKLEIRESTPGDVSAIESLYPAAFPEENLLPLVRSLLDDPKIALSLVATVDSALAGHVVFTACEVDGSSVKAALLGPLAVAPLNQRQGIGTALVREGLQRLRDSGIRLVCVLGDPAYYGRLEFVPESLVGPPYILPPEWEGAWQSRYLDDRIAPCAGQLILPAQWLQPALWAP